MTGKWVLLFIDVHVYILNLTFAGRNCLGDDEEPKKKFSLVVLVQLFLHCRCLGDYYIPDVMKVKKMMIIM